MTSMSPAKRLAQLPTYVFAELLELKRNLDPEWLIDLSLGTPDSQTPAPILDELHAASLDPANHGYPPFDGKMSLRSGVVRWFRERFGVEIGEDNVLPLLGAKEGLAHLPLAYLDPGDLSLVPDPHYPVHERGSLLAGAEVYPLSLLQENSFLPDLGAVPAAVAKRAKLMILNYPNNPTGAVASLDFLSQAAEFCRRHDIMLCHDLAYCELAFGASRPTSIFDIMTLEEPAIEFFTFSKTYHMAGWRIGFCVGNRDIVRNLYALKTNMDYGVSGAIQDAALRALNMPADYYRGLSQMYARRVSLLRERLAGELGWPIFQPGGAMYLWVPAPCGNGTLFAKKLLAEAGIVTTPGIAFGSQGYGYVRMALVQPEDKLMEAADRISSLYRDP